MGLDGSYNAPVARPDAVKLIRAAFERGVTLFDTAEAYGPITNEQLLGQAIKPFRDEVVIATKFGFGINPDGSRYGLDSRPEHTRTVVDDMLGRLVVRQHRPSLSAPRRPERPDRGRRRHVQGAHLGLQGRAFTACPKRARGPSGAHMPSIL